MYYYSAIKLRPMFKLILLCPILMFALCANAQRLKESKAEKYKSQKPIDTLELEHGGVAHIYDDRSAKMRFVGELILGHIETHSGDLCTWSVGGSSDVIVGKYGSLHGSYLTPLLSIERIIASDNNINEKAIRGAGTWEIGGSVFLVDKHKYAKHKIVLATKHSYKIDIEYVSYCKLPCRRIYALRAGYYGHRALVTTDMNSGELTVDEHGAVRATDGTLLYNEYYTNSFSNGAYFGLSRLTLMNTISQVSTEKELFRGEGSFFASRKYAEIYADVIIADTKFNSIVDGYGTYQIVPNQPGSFQTSSFGGRVGLKSLVNKGGYNLGQKIEAGYRPGLKGFGWYACMVISVGIIK